MAIGREPIVFDGIGRVLGAEGTVGPWTPPLEVDPWGFGDVRGMGDEWEVIEDVICGLERVLVLIRLAAGPLCFLGGVIIGRRLAHASRT